MTILCRQTERAFPPRGEREREKSNYRRICLQIYQVSATFWEALAGGLTSKYVLHKREKKVLKREKEAINMDSVSERRLTQTHDMHL